ATVTIRGWGGGGGRRDGIRPGSPRARPSDSVDCPVWPGGAPAIGREEFEEQLHGALRLLYDHARLESHPLAAALRGGAEPRGRALRRLLLDAIQELKPGRDTPRGSADFYHYQ